jgi:hypothetical protein
MVATLNPADRMILEEPDRARSLSSVLGPASSKQLPAELTVFAASFFELYAEVAFKHAAPVEFEWFDEREKDEPRTHDIAIQFAMATWHRTAWLLEHLHYDQVLKQSIVDGKGRNLGHPLFGIAQVASLIGQFSVARHYAALATIGDVLFHGPMFRGAAPHSLANLSDWSSFERLHRDTVESIKAWDHGTPICPEAILAAHWLPKKRAQVVLRLASVASGEVPFVDRLLNAANRTSDKAEAGTLFEAAAALLFSSTAGFEVRGARDDVSSQTDILLLYRQEAGSRVVLPEGHLLVECKYRKKAVSASMVREFGARCLLRNVPLGILIAKNKITGAETVDTALRNAERERREFLGRGAHILVLSADDLRSKSRELRGLESDLLEDYEHLRFGRRS